MHNFQVITSKNELHMKFLNNYLSYYSLSTY